MKPYSCTEAVIKTQHFETR